MFFSYIKDMKSWIFFFLGMLGLADAILWLDQGIAVEFFAVLYVNVVLLAFFLLFFIWRYRVEMAFTKKLATFTEVQIDDWDEVLREEKFIRDQITNDMFQRMLTFIKQELSSAKQSTAIKKDYTAAWVHEVKAPLTAMKLTIDANRTDPIVRKIESEWLRVHLLIDQQLSIARLPSLEADYILEKTSVKRIVTAEIRELVSWCMEKNIAVEFEGEDVEVITDVKWCRFMIRQLLTNAVKYSPSNGTIFIIMNRTSLGHVTLIIKDEGDGIPPHDLPRIFDKGFTGGAGRLHNAATGLGLYLVQTVADKIGITLSVQSEIAQGTEICLTFSKKNEFDKVLN